MPIYVNGKRIDDDANAPEIQKVPYIAADQIFKHDGPVVIEGDVGAGAKITITNGGLRVIGNVYDGVEIDVKSPSSSGSTSISGVTIANAKGVTIVNGSIISGSFNGNVTITDSGITGINIEGKIEDRVTLKSNTDIAIGLAGQYLKADTDCDFNAIDIGAYADIQAGCDSTITSLGDNSKVDSRCDNSIDQVANNCKIKAGCDNNINRLGKNSEAKAGCDNIIAVMDKTAKARAGCDNTVARKIDL